MMTLNLSVWHGNGYYNFDMFSLGGISCAL